MNIFAMIFAILMIGVLLACTITMAVYAGLIATVVFIVALLLAGWIGWGGNAPVDLGHDHSLNSFQQSLSPKKK